MKLFSLKRSLCLVLSGMMTIGSPLMANGPVEVRTSDFTLNDGVLAGSVLNTSAQPVSGLNVHLLHGDKVVATAVSDENGQFAVRGLRNGNHVLQVGAVQQPVRFWGHQAAPPSSTSRMSIVVDEEVVRGQACGEGCDDGCGESIGAKMVSPCALLLIGGAVAAVLVLTLDDDDDDVPASP